MVTFSLQQEVAYSILAFFVLVIFLCILNVLYNLLVYMLNRNVFQDETENITIVITSN